MTFLGCTLLILTSCDIDKTKDGEMPTVDVNIETEKGSLPEFDVDWVDINLGTKTKKIMVPTVEVVMEEKEVEVPFIDAEWPDDRDDIVEQIISVEAEVVDNKYDLEIEEVYAKGDKLMVISRLEKEDVQLGGKSIRVSDQIVINAPDLSVKHYIIGNKPKRNFNNNYSYITNIDKISNKLENAKKIYG